METVLFTFLFFFGNKDVFFAAAPEMKIISTKD